MKKVFMAVIIVFTCVFIYLGAKLLFDYLNDVYIFMSDSSSQSATSGSFAFKKTPENIELVNSYLNVNNYFISNMSKDVLIEKNINNIHSLINKFPSFKDYYSAKLKLNKAIFEGVPYLCENCLKLNDTELENFFSDNLTYLDKTFGITTLDQLSNIVTNLSFLKNKEIKYSEVPENSVVYNPYGGSTVFRIKAGYDSNDFVYFSINAFHGYNTENQKAPVIVFNALGGMS